MSGFHTLSWPANGLSQCHVSCATCARLTGVVCNVDHGYKVSDLLTDGVVWKAQRPGELGFIYMIFGGIMYFVEPQHRLAKITTFLNWDTRNVIDQSEPFLSLSHPASRRISPDLNCPPLARHIYAVPPSSGVLALELIFHWMRRNNIPSEKRTMGLVYPWSKNGISLSQNE